MRIKFNISALRAMYGYGGIDIFDEWQSDGNYYKYLGKDLYDLKHNYQVDFRKNYTTSQKTGRQYVKSYNVYVFLCLNASNSKEFTVFRGESKTLSQAKKSAFDQIIAYEQSDRFEQEIVNVYLPRMAKPVFTYINNILTLIGTTYHYCGSDSDYKLRDKETWLYYNDDIPEYNKYKMFYALDVSNFLCPEGTSKVHITQKFSTGYSGGQIWDNEVKVPLVKEMLKLIKDNPRYKSLLDRLDYSLLELV